jgi:hypothetical protein
MSYRNLISAMAGLIVVALAASVGWTPAAAGAGPTTDCALPVFGPGATYRPRFDASSFSPDVTNPFFRCMWAGSTVLDACVARCLMAEICTPCQAR